MALCRQNETKNNGQVVARNSSSASLVHAQEVENMAPSPTSIASSQRKFPFYPPTSGSETPDQESGEDQEASSHGLGQTNGGGVKS